MIRFESSKHSENQNQPTVEIIQIRKEMILIL